jgi:large subunit ribosomal protein L7/L12
MSEAAVADLPAEITSLGDKIADLTLKQAKQLSDYIENKYGIKPAAGGAVMMAPAGGGGGAAAPAAEPTEFDVILTSFGDKKLDVVKVAKNITGASLMDAKKLVEAAPSTIKERVSKEDAAKFKAELEAAGAKVDLKGVG